MTPEGNGMSYVIMLYRDQYAYHDDWPVRKEADNIDTLRKETQCSGNPELYPKSGYSAEYVEAKSLTDTKTGSVETGAIYKWAPK
jgi:hypothetical protein